MITQELREIHDELDMMLLRLKRVWEGIEEMEVDIRRNWWIQEVPWRITLVMDRLHAVLEQVEAKRD